MLDCYICTSHADVWSRNSRISLRRVTNRLFMPERGRSRGTFIKNGFLIRPFLTSSGQGERGAGGVMKNCMELDVFEPLNCYGGNPHSGLRRDFRSKTDRKSVAFPFEALRFGGHGDVYVSDATLKISIEIGFWPSKTDLVSPRC
jgi:hypothetical protein